MGFKKRLIFRNLVNTDLFSLLLFVFVLLCLYFYFETGSQYLAMTFLKLTKIHLPLSPELWVKGMCGHAAMPPFVNNSSKTVGAVCIHMARALPTKSWATFSALYP